MAHFKTRANSYAVGKAPTGRARCRACRKLIERGELRFMTHAFVRPGRATTFMRHVRCADAAFAAAVLATHGTPQGLPVHGELDAVQLECAHAALERAVAWGRSRRTPGGVGAAAPEASRPALQSSAASVAPMTIERFMKSSMSDVSATSSTWCTRSSSLSPQRTAEHSRSLSTTAEMTPSGHTRVTLHQNRSP